jgi:hypothetical protein
MLFSPEMIRQAMSRQSSSIDTSSTTSTNQRPSPPTTNHLSTSADLLSASLSTTLCPSPVPTEINAEEDNGQLLIQPSSYLFCPIGEDNVSGKTTPVFGHETPACPDTTTAELKAVFKDREKGALSYSVGEHVALLQLMLTYPNSFNASENSEEWGELYQHIRKAVAESSTKLTDTLAAFIANQGNDDAGIDAKLNVFKIIYFNSWMQENKLLRLGLPQSLMINLGIYLGF